MNLDPESRWYGFTRVTPKEKSTRVKRVFSSVANKYDLMNDLMSLGLHRLWKHRFVGKARPRAHEIIVDMAGGTGDIALMCADKSGGGANIVVCDINEEMLRAGCAKAIDRGYLKGLSWVLGSAEKLPFKDRSVDLLCISFGLRNVTHIDKALAEFARVLKIGGRFFCMDFSPSVMPCLKSIYDLYSVSVLPWLGENVAHDREAYTYLVESIRKFPTPEALSKRMKYAGFDNVKHEALAGGIVAIHSGWIL